MTRTGKYATPIKIIFDKCFKKTNILMHNTGLTNNIDKIFINFCTNVILTYTFIKIIYTIPQGQSGAD